MNLVKNKLDIIFANEQEITSLIEAKNFEEVINFSKQLNKLIIVTRIEKGAVAINGEGFWKRYTERFKNCRPTGAGDLFASDFYMGT